MQGAVGCRGATQDRNSRARLIRAEVAALANGEAASAAAASSLGRKVRSLIAGELETLLAPGALVSGAPLRSAPPDVEAIINRYAPRPPSTSRRKPAAGSQSMPMLELSHPEQLRKMVSRRNARGGFISDVTPWQVDSGSAPSLPSRHREMSRSMWSKMNPVYLDYPEASDQQSFFRDPTKEKDPALKQFCNPRDDYILWRDEIMKQRALDRESRDNREAKQ